jgi:hypothetical protein
VKEQRVRVPLALVVGLALAGCGGKERISQAEPRRPEPAGKSTVSVIVDGITGKTVIEAGQEAKRQLRDIDEKRRKEIEEFVE